MAALLLMLVLPLSVASPTTMNRLGGYTYGSGPGHTLGVPGGWLGSVEPRGGGGGGGGGWPSLNRPFPFNDPSAPIPNAPPQIPGSDFSTAEALSSFTGGASSKMNGASSILGDIRLGRFPQQNEAAVLQTNGPAKHSSSSFSSFMLDDPMSSSSRMDNNGDGGGGNGMNMFPGGGVGGDVFPVGVAADYSHFAGQMGGNAQANSPDLLGLYSVPLSDVQSMLMSRHGSGGMMEPAKNSLSHDFPSPAAQQGMASMLSSNAKIDASAMALDAKAKGPPSSSFSSFISEKQQQPGPGYQLSYVQQHQPQVDKVSHDIIPSPPNLMQPLSVGPPSAEELLMSNLFVMGMDKPSEHKPHVPEPPVSASKSRGLGPIPGLTEPASVTAKASANTAGKDQRAPCDLLVDTVFALDDIDMLWMARESIRFYQTQLRPSAQAHFGVVLCGQQKTFYTALHGHFSALLASLEDLQHANATLEPKQHMPDTPGLRAENNPYPPRVSEDFAQTDAGCLETAYHLFAYRDQSSNVERLLTVVGTKERWGDPTKVDEARFLHSVNISLLSLADGALSAHAHTTMRNMASSPDMYRPIADNVTLHALPEMIGRAICRPQKADITGAVQRTSVGKVQEPEVIGCQQINSTSLERTMDFGRFFGIHTDQIKCVPGLVPDAHLCACV